MSETFREALILQLNLKARNKELWLGQTFSSSRSTIVTASLSSTASSKSVRVALIDITGPKVLAYQELALSTKSKFDVINKLFIIPRYNGDNMSSLLLLSKAGGN